MATIIKSGTIITADDIYKGDVFIENEKIKKIGTNFINNPNDTVINAKGKYVFPGGVDVHTHFDLPMFGTVSSDDHYTGHKAAAFGGTTTVIDFVPQDKISLIENVEAWHEKADPKAAIDFGFHMNITTLDATVESEIPKLKNAGISSVKVFTAYNDRLRLSDGDIFKVMRIARDNDMLVIVHAEEGDVIEILVNEAIKSGHTSPKWHALTRPADGAVESVFRSIMLAKQAQVPVYIVHMNTAGGVERVRWARLAGLPVMAETCPQYLFFDSKYLERSDGSKWICSPPLRTISDNEGLLSGIKDGSVQVIATDHCAFFYDGTTPIDYEGETIAIPGKELGKDDFTKIPNGLPGVGDRLPILWTKLVGEKLISPSQFIALNCTNPAKIFGLYPKKGTLVPGADADIVIWDPEIEIDYGVKYSQHRTDYNLYEGWHIKGFIEKVLLRGNLIVDNRKWLGKKGMGKYIHRKAPVIL